MAEKSSYYLPAGLPAPKAQRDGMDAGFWEALRRHELVQTRRAAQLQPEAMTVKP